MKYIAFLTGLLILSPLAFCETEGKSKAQIQNESDAVISGTVLSVVRHQKIDEFSSYYCAEIEVEKIEKGLLAERQLTSVKVYYRNATKEGVFSEHAPRLLKGQKIKLYGQLKRGIVNEGFVLVIPSIERVENLDP